MHSLANIYKYLLASEVIKANIGSLVQPLIKGLHNLERCIQIHLFQEHSIYSSRRIPKPRFSLSVCEDKHPLCMQDKTITNIRHV